MAGTFQSGTFQWATFQTGDPVGYTVGTLDAWTATASGELVTHGELTATLGGWTVSASGTLYTRPSPASGKIGGRGARLTVTPGGGLSISGSAGGGARLRVS